MSVGGGRADAGPPRVLVLEDEAVILMDLAYALEDEGAEPVTAPTVALAMEEIERSVPDAAILDVNLGGGTTCEPVAARLAALGVPFVLHSGDLDRQGELIAGLGAPLLPKPTPGALVARHVLSLTARSA